MQSPTAEVSPCPMPNAQQQTLGLAPSDAVRIPLLALPPEELGQLAIASPNEALTPKCCLWSGCRSGPATTVARIVAELTASTCGLPCGETSEGAVTYPLQGGGWPPNEQTNPPRPPPPHLAS